MKHLGEHLLENMIIIVNCIWINLREKRFVDLGIFVSFLQYSQYSHRVVAILRYQESIMDSLAVTIKVVMNCEHKKFLLQVFHLILLLHCHDI